MIDRETVDRIYAAANIVDIIGDYVTLKRKGVNYQACCPFHNEKTPSFVVSPSKGVYKCFGCGKGGNAVTFLMEHENITYPEALKMVAKRYGIEVREKELSEEEIRRNDDRESMFVLNGWAAEYFANYLHRETEGQSVGLAYFRQARGLTDATIRKFGLGFCPAKGDRMSKDALAAGYKKEFLLSTGLSLARERDGSLYDRFRDRVIFPVHNISGRVVAFGGRTLRTDKTVAKYQNSPESEIYSKKRELYGLYFAKRAIQQQDFAIMVEGYLDVISMHQAGIENVVASSGTSLTTEQIRLLGRFTKNITVIYDGDSAGIHASLRGIDMILKEGMNVRVVLLPEPEDPDSFARSHTASEVQAYIRDHERDFLEFKANLLLQDAEGDPIRKAALIGDMVQSIAQIPDPIQRSVYVKECARIMDIDENILISEVARKRLTTSGDREADEFLRRQAAQRQREAAQPEVEYVRDREIPAQVRALFVRLQGGPDDGGVQRRGGGLRRAGAGQYRFPQPGVRQNHGDLPRTVGAAGYGDGGPGALFPEPHRPGGVQRLGGHSHLGRQLRAQPVVAAQGDSRGERRRDAGRRSAEGCDALQVEGSGGDDQGVAGEAGRREPARGGAGGVVAAAVGTEQGEGVDRPQAPAAHFVKKGREPGRTRIPAHTVCKQKINRKMCKNISKINESVI